MDSDDQIWNRDALYEEVWSTPMKALAKKYSISDVGLAKVCRKLAIPLPGRGHWAKKDAGHKVEQLPLPALREKIVLRRPTPGPEPPKLSDFASPPEMALVEQLERTVGEVPLKRGSLSHPLIAQARSLLGKGREDDHGILWISEPCLDIRVSQGSLDRALRIIAGLISLIEDAGFRVSIVPHERKHHTVAKIHGEDIRFGVLEKVDRIEIAAPQKGGLLERVLTYAGKPVTFKPSGKLSVQVWNSWGSDRGKWADGKLRLEERLSAIVAGFLRLALADRADREQRAANKREHDRLVEEQVQLEGRVQAEKSKVRALVRATAGWSRAEQIRAFVSAARDAAIQNGQSEEPGSLFGEWITWAEQQADRLDPLKESPPSIMDRIEETTAAYPTYYGYRNPEPPFRFPKPIWRMK